MSGSKDWTRTLPLPGFKIIMDHYHMSCHRNIIVKFVWETREKQIRDCSWTKLPKNRVSLTAVLDPCSHPVHHEWPVLWELWGRAVWSWGENTRTKGDQAADHPAHAQVQSWLTRWIPKELTQGFSTWVTAKLPTALQKAVDEPQHQPPEAPLHSGPHSQVESITLCYTECTHMHVYCSVLIKADNLYLHWTVKVNILVTADWVNVNINVLA